VKLITLLLPESYIEALENLVRRKLYPDRSEAIRLAIRDLIVAHDVEPFKTNKEVEA